MDIDQTGVILVPGLNNTTYEKKKTKQVLIYRKDENFVFTFVLSGSSQGKVLLI